MSSPRRTAVLAVHLSTRVLPAETARERYRQEFVAELHELDESRQLRYAARVVSRAWALRRAVTEENTMEAEHAKQKTRPLHCRLHLYHHHRKTSTEDGQVLLACVDCGHIKDNYLDPTQPSISSRGLPMGG